MASYITVKIDQAQIDGITRDLANIQGGVPKVMVRALNRTASWARTRALDAIATNINVKKKDLDGKHRFGGVTTRRANKNDQRASVKITGRRIPLFRFDGKPKEPWGRRGLLVSRIKDRKETVTRGRGKKGISYRIDTKGARKYLKKNAFPVRFKSGHVGFYYRKGSERLPIQQFYGPSIPHAAEKSPAFQQMLTIDASAQLAVNIQREVNYLLTGNSSGTSEA